MNTTPNATARHTPWCDSALCITDPVDGSIIHTTAPLVIETSAGPAELTAIDAGQGRKIMLSVSDEGMTPEEARRLGRALTDLADHTAV